ncbi:putative porin [Sulfurimonas sp.]|uniref:putative porin n=1 Tax=Sulfurimonas sp. TaxID=2022749 RepID=UPI0019F8428C|nr:putative porin [Sulfurimonas sp.]MBE0513713.1 putative porin [Sulfurimonas sp.]
MKKIVLSVVAIATITAASMANETVSSAEATKAENKSGFFDRFHAKGDLRLRQEVIEKEGKADVNRERYRFRYSVNFDVTDNITLETAVSSGKYNPTSGNVSFKSDENIQEYFIDELKIDIVDIKYSFDNSWVRVGKQAHHIYRPIKTQLVWDNDIRLEGINYGYKNDSTIIRVGANRVHREKDYKDGDDINIFLAQYVHTQKLDDTKLNLGAAYYLYDGIKGNTVQSSNGFKNNSNANGLYTEDYGIAEAFAEVQVKDLVMGMPAKAAVTLAYNTLVSDENFGYDVSAELAMTKKWNAAVTYRDIQKDAVYGAHNDSDFSGGGTDSKGYYVKTKYAFAKNVDVAGWWNWSKLGDAELDYHRVQLDVILKF